MILDIMKKEINKINDQIKKLEKKRHDLIMEKSEYVEYLNTKDKEPVSDTTEEVVKIDVEAEVKPEEINHVGFCLYKETGESNRRDNITWYHLNKNPNVSKEVPIIIENNPNVFALDDSKNERGKEVIMAFAKEYNIKIIGE